MEKIAAGEINASLGAKYEKPLKYLDTEVMKPSNFDKCVRDHKGGWELECDTANFILKFLYVNKNLERKTKKEITSLLKTYMQNTNLRGGLFLREFCDNQKTLSKSALSNNFKNHKTVEEFIAAEILSIAKKGRERTHPFRAWAGGAFRIARNITVLAAHYLAAVKPDNPLRSAFLKYCASYASNADPGVAKKETVSKKETETRAVCKHAVRKHAVRGPKEAGKTLETHKKRIMHAATEAATQLPQKSAPAALEISVSAQDARQAAKAPLTITVPKVNFTQAMKKQILKLITLVRNNEKVAGAENGQRLNAIELTIADLLKNHSKQFPDIARHLQDRTPEYTSDFIKKLGAVISANYGKINFLGADPKIKSAVLKEVNTALIKLEVRGFAPGLSPQEFKIDFSGKDEKGRPREIKGGRFIPNF